MRAEDEDHEAAARAISASLNSEPRFREDPVDYMTCERAALALSRVSPSRDGTVAVEDVGPCEQCVDTAGGFRCHDCDRMVTTTGQTEDDIDIQVLMRRRDRLTAAYNELRGDAVVDEEERKHRTKLLKAVDFLLAEFSPASTGDREAPNPGTGHGE